MMAPLRPYWSSVAVCLVLIAADQHQVLMWMACLLVVEVQWANRRWVAGGLSLAATVAGLSSAGMSRLPVAAVVVTVLAVVLLRLELELAERNAALSARVAVVEERVSMAHHLHDRVADSLTRVVLLAEQPRPDISLIADEARKSVTKLHSIMGQLKGGDDRPTDSVVDLSQLVGQSVSTLRAAGLAVNVSKVPAQALVSETTADGIRELFTNVLKHGESPVRIMLEIDEDSGRILVTNALPPRPQAATMDSGLGLSSAESTFQRDGEIARAILEFRLEQVR